MLRRLFFSILWAACFLSVSFYLAFLVAGMLRNEKFFSPGGTFADIVLLLLMGTPFLGATFVFLTGMRGRLPGTKHKNLSQQ
jgi:hypothetical protein